MAINEKAWAVVMRFMPTHYIGLTGPCCDLCSRALAIATAVSVEGYTDGYIGGYQRALEINKDDPEKDCTDFAHPAWWRGAEYAHVALVKEVNELLDGGAVRGTCNEPWQSLRKRLFRLALWDRLLVSENWEMRNRT